MKIGQICKIINFNNELNGIIVKVNECYMEGYIVEIVDKSLLEDEKIQRWFHNAYKYNNRWYKWYSIYYLKPLYRKEKLKRLLK